MPILRMCMWKGFDILCVRARDGLEKREERLT